MSKRARLKCCPRCGLDLHQSLDQLRRRYDTLIEKAIRKVPEYAGTIRRNLEECFDREAVALFGDELVTFENGRWAITQSSAQQ